MHKQLLLLLFISPVFLAAQADKQFADYLADHNAAFRTFEPIAPNVTHSVTTHHGYRETVYIHNYTYPNQDAKNVHEAYKSALKSLEQEMVKNSTGDGFMLGVLLAVASRLVTGSKINKGLATSGIIIPSIMWTMYQNKNSAVTPYFETDISRQNNLFANMSFLTFGRTCMSMLGATAGFLGTAYTLERIAQLFKTKNNAQPNSPRANTLT